MPTLMKPIAATALVAMLALAPSLTASAALPSATDPAGQVQWAVAPATIPGQADRATFAYTVDPGREIRDYVAISNTGATAATFTLYGTDATNDFETGAFSLLPADQKPTDIGSWVHLEQSEVTLAPGADAIVEFGLSIPTDASPGEHVAGIVASYKGETTNAQGQAVVLDQRVGTRVYLTVNGAAAASLEPVGVVAGYASPWNPFGGGDADIDYAVRNTGNMRLNVAQTVTISGPFGIVLGSFQLEPVKELLPRQSVHITETFPGLPPMLMLFAEVELTPTLVAAPADPNAAPLEPVTTSAITLAVPWTLIGLLVLVIGGAIVLVRYLRASRERFFDALDEAERTRAEAAAAAAAAASAAVTTVDSSSAPVA